MYISLMIYRKKRDQRRSKTNGMRIFLFFIFYRINTLNCINDRRLYCGKPKTEYIPTVYQNVYRHFDDRYLLFN